MVSSILILTTLIYLVVSKTITCDEPNCEFDICTLNNECTNNTYICTSNAATCTLQCQHCTNIALISSSPNTQLSCNQNNSCNNITIHITQQIDSKPNPNSLLLTCAHSSSCSNINISCNNPNLCQCKNYENTHCSNINYNNDLENDMQTQQNNQFIFDEQGTAVILIIFVILFWCLVCFCVPLYIKRWRHKMRMLLKDPVKIVPNIIDINDINDVDVIVDLKEPVCIQQDAATHRKVLSNSMMARIVNHMGFANKSDSYDSDNEVVNDIKRDGDDETMVQNAKDILKCIHTNNNGGEFELIINTNNGEVQSLSQSPESAESVASQILNVPNELDSLNSNKAQKLSVSHTFVSDFSSGALKLPVETSIGSAVTRTLTSSDLKLPNFQISMMSPSNMSPPTNITNNDGAIECIDISHLGCAELELLCTESQVNEKLNGDYVD